jgi:putative lipoprotein
MHRRALLALAALPAAAAAETAEIRGSATYRERMALGPGAVLEVVLEDFARADAPATRIAEAIIPVARQVPIPFVLAYDPARLDPRGRHGLRATLRQDRQVLFRTDWLHPVQPGQTAPVTLMLVRETGGAAAPAAAFIGHRWIAAAIRGEPVAQGVVSDITFGADHGAYGMGGCNRFRGGWTTEGAAGLALGPLASTMMACDGPQDAQERRFLEALGAVRRWRMEGETLILSDAGGAALLRLMPSGR